MIYLFFRNLQNHFTYFLKKTGTFLQAVTVSKQLSINVFIQMFCFLNRFRRLMIEITGSRLFDNFVLFLIVLSCGFMVFDNPSSAMQVIPKLLKLSESLLLF